MQLLVRLFVLILVGIFIIALGSFAFLLAAGVVLLIAILVLLSKIGKKPSREKEIHIYPPDKKNPKIKV